MGFIGVQPTSAPLTTSDITNDIVNADKIADDSISDEHLDITSITGQTAITSLADTDKFLVSQASDSGNLKYVEKQYLGGGGGLGFLSRTFISSNVAEVEFTGISASAIRIVFQNVGTDNASGTNIRVQLGDSSSYRSGAGTYNAAHQANRLDSASGVNEQESSTSMRLVDNIGNTAGGSLAGYLDVFAFSDSSAYMWANFHLAHQRKAGGYYSKKGGCWFNMDFAADRIKFFLSSGGDFTEGEFLLYEYKEA